MRTHQKLLNPAQLRCFALLLGGSHEIKWKCHLDFND